MKFVEGKDAKEPRQCLLPTQKQKSREIRIRAHITDANMGTETSSCQIAEAQPWRESIRFQTHPPDLLASASLLSLLLLAG